MLHLGDGWWPYFGWLSRMCACWGLLYDIYLAYQRWFVIQLCINNWFLEIAHVFQSVWTQRKLKNMILKNYKVQVWKFCRRFRFRFGQKGVWTGLNWTSAMLNRSWTSAESSLCRCAEGSGNASETHFSTIFQPFFMILQRGWFTVAIFHSFFTSFFLIFTGRVFSLAVKMREKWIQKQLKNGWKMLPWAPLLYALPPFFSYLIATMPSSLCNTCQPPPPHLTLCHLWHWQHTTTMETGGWRWCDVAVTMDDHNNDQQLRTMWRMRWATMDNHKDAWVLPPPSSYPPSFTLM